jgi:WD40 repeat protein
MPTFHIKNIIKVIFLNFELCKIDQLTNILRNKCLVEVVLRIDRFALFLGETCINFTSNPSRLQYKETITDSCPKNYNIFASFTCIEGRRQVAWGTRTYDIQVYDQGEESISFTLMGHKATISVIKHFRKTIDYLISASSDYNCKVWSLKEKACLVDLTGCHKGIIYAALIVYDHFRTFEHYIITSAAGDIIKVWDFQGKEIREMGTSRLYTYYMYAWYDSRNNSIYLFSANVGNVTMLDFHTGKAIKCFTNGESEYVYSTVRDYNYRPHLFGTSGKGLVTIWDIDKCTVSMSIMVPNSRDLVIWNDRYAVTHSIDSFEIIDIVKGDFNSIKGCGLKLWSIEKTKNPRYGECLLALSREGSLTLWTME